MSSATTTTKSTSTKSASTADVTPFAITSTFSPPAECSTQFYMLKNKDYQIWFNPILPVPGTTETSCYASEFVSSSLLQAGGVTQAAFSPLVCPLGWQTQGPYTSNYIACCPSGFQGIQPNSLAPSDRPASGGTCYSGVYQTTLIVTQYGDDAITATSAFTGTATNDQIYAAPYEGFAYGVAVVTSLTTSESSTTTTGSSSLSSSSSSTVSSTTSSAPAATSSAASSGGLTSGQIAGAVVGSLAGAALILGLMAFLFARRRRNRSRDAEGGVGKGYDPQSPYSQNASTLPGYAGRDDDKEVVRATQEKYGNELEAKSPASEMAADRIATELPGSHASPTESYEMYAGEAPSTHHNKNLPGVPDQSPTLGNPASGH